MLRPLSRLVLVLPLFACPADDDEGGDTSGAETTGTASTTQGNTTTSASTSDGTTASTSTNTGSTSASTSTDGSESSDDTTPATSEDSGSETAVDGSSSGGADLCAPDGGDEACVACGKSMCCEAYAACYVDPDCACAVDCILMTGDYETCLGEMCNNPDPTPAMDIGICYGTTCAAACGF